MLGCLFKLTKNEKYKTTKTVTKPLIINVALAPKLNHISPAIELANIVKML